VIFIIPPELSGDSVAVSFFRKLAPDSGIRARAQTVKGQCWYPEHPFQRGEPIGYSYY